MTTTSEFIIGHSADDAAERKAELRKIGWALLAAIFLHLVIGYSLARFSGVFFSDSTPIEENDKPVELTMIELPVEPVAATPVPSTLQTFVDPAKESARPPTDKTFLANANSTAASELPAISGGESVLPSQEGKERNWTDLDDNKAIAARDGVRPQPTAQPEETPQVAQESIPQPSLKPNEDALALITPQPAKVPKTQPARASAFRPHQEKTRIKGAISNRGPSAVNAVGTPLLRYQKVVFDSIGSRWYGTVEDKLDLFGIGTVRVVFQVDRGGNIKNLKILENSSNEAFLNFCLRAIQEAKLPPIPDELAATMPPEGLEVELPFTIYTN